MIATRRTQSLTQFRQKATETLERLNKSGDAEIITVNGEARAILLSPSTYDEMAREAQLSRDAKVMRTAIEQINDGKGRPANEFFDDLKARLLSMKSGKHRN
jgi:PHD/YefM family antitoxin component YafN of YafNO toxin-antitoxin module